MKTATKKETVIPFGRRYSRWIAAATYRSDRGLVVVDYYVEEIEELHDLIEYGPNWLSLVELKVVLNPDRTTRPDITMEAAERM
jgi:hypothetical protein